jgi:hypothetical protein
VERIRANSLRQTQRLIDGADARGFEVRSPREPERRGGHVTVHVPDFEAVHKELSERQILCDFRPDAGIRLGPHYFNSDDELEHRCSTRSRTSWHRRARALARRDGSLLAMAGSDPCHGRNGASGNRHTTVRRAAPPRAGARPCARVRDSNRRGAVKFTRRKEHHDA